ncbi:hypothetical protein NFI96_026180 [Prochilodus magdalenae]|nr:hypothetical protein NFI96_026180 [Prochilodus magdalenae]
MVSAQQLLHSHREVLLDWLSVNPTPLLRWLADAGVLTPEQYRAVLERSPTNKVANVLEQVCTSEESSRAFLQVLRQVQGYYCTQLQEWIRQHCTETPPHPQPNTPGVRSFKNSYTSFQTSVVWRSLLTMEVLRSGAGVELGVLLSLRDEDAGYLMRTVTLSYCSGPSYGTCPDPEASCLGVSAVMPVQPTCPFEEDPLMLQLPTPPVFLTERKKTKGLLSKLHLRGKSQEFTLPHTDEASVTPLRPPNVTRSASSSAASLNAHRSTLLRQTERLMSYSEGGGQDSSSHAHIDIRYTDLFVTEDDERPTDDQHEYFRFAGRRSPIYPHQACRLIHPRDLLNPEPQTGVSPKRVKVKGVAGIGKSVAVQRLLYEWALGKQLQSFSCVFDLRFRELGLIEEPVSLRELLASRFLYLDGILPDLIRCAESLLFILDGLDEFRHRLDWDGEDLQLTVDTKVPISKLLVALVRGHLLPECSLILTTRPSADAPKQFFQQCCVVLGFQEKHVEEYTTRFYRDPLVAKTVFSYIAKNDSLFALSFIPLYCYIICSALAEFFSTDHDKDERSLDLDPPRTVSEVYYCYLYTTIKHHALKDRAGPTSRPQVLAGVKEQLMKLGRLAYESLLRNRILFHRKDLEEFGLDPTGIRSTFLSQILVSMKEEKVEMFVFFHLTIQEYLAALFCVVRFSSPADILAGLHYWCFGEPVPPAESPPLTLNLPPAGDDLERPRVEHLQMFTRFFCGLVRARLARLLEGLAMDCLGGEDGDLPAQIGDWFQSQFRNRELSNQTTLNLLHCLMELHMQETTGRTAPEIRTLNLFKMKLSVVDCAAVYYVLKFSKHRLKELNLGYSNIGNRGFSRLGPILHRCESLYVRYNCLGTDAAILESAVLRSEDCQVKKLFMCGNRMGPEGARALWAALEHNNTVEEVYLDITGITETGTENLVQCLSRNTALKSLTVVGNELGEAGWERLKELGRLRPDLRIIGHFVDDLGLLEAYLGWVDEMQTDREQMDSVKNADALQSVLKGLWLSKGTGQNAVKAKELETKILQLLESRSLDCGRKPEHLEGETHTDMRRTLEFRTARPWLPGRRVGPSAGLHSTTVKGI